MLPSSVEADSKLDELYEVEKLNWVKNNFGQNFLGSKKNFGPKKNFCVERFFLKFGLKKNLVKKIRVEKIIRSKKFLGQINFWVREICGLKKCVG